MADSKTAIVFGATGLIGGYLVKALNDDSKYVSIKIFTRKPTGLKLTKAKEFITDFKNEKELASQVAGDEIFCCLGTTIRKAGSQDAFRKVDHDLPVMIGRIAVKNNIAQMLVVSSLGADAGSSNFYIRTKGEMEKDLLSLSIPKVKFFRPSMLLGPRTESRPGETIGKILMKAFDWLLIGKLSKYKAIHAKTVALAMVKVANTETAVSVFESDAIAKLV